MLCRLVFVNETNLHGIMKLENKVVFLVKLRKLQICNKCVLEVWCHGHAETNMSPTEKSLYVLTSHVLRFGPPWLHFQSDLPFLHTVSTKKNKKD